MVDISDETTGPPEDFGDEAPGGGEAPSSALTRGSAPRTAPRPAASAVGRILAGKYRIMKPLGEGGMGAVYVARHEQLGADVALKLMRPEFAAVPQFERRFLNEVKAAQAFVHKHAVQVRDFGVDERSGAVYMTMDLCPGRSLEDLLRQQGKLPVRFALEIAAQMCDVLQEAHQASIVHRDLKPANIMVEDRQGRPFVRVLDFGIAKILAPDDESAENITALTQAGTTLGTLHYMSPEQAMADPIDGRSDLYSLGVVLFEMITGKLPIKAETAQKMLSAIVTQAPVPPSAMKPGQHIPQAVDEILLRVLSKDPDERYPTADHFRAAVQDVLARLQEEQTLPTLDVDAAAVAEAGKTPTDTQTDPLAQAKGEQRTTDATVPQDARRRGSPAAPVLVVLLLLAAAGAYYGLVHRPQQNRARATADVRTLVEKGLYDQAINAAERARNTHGSSGELDALESSALAGKIRITLQALLDREEYDQVIQDGPGPGDLSGFIEEDRKALQALIEQARIKRAAATVPPAVEPEPDELVDVIEQGAPSRPKPATVIIVTRPAAATVSMDGRQIGASPLAGAEVSAGTHKLAIRLKGHEEITRTIELTPGQTFQQSFDLKPLPASIRVFVPGGLDVALVNAEGKQLAAKNSGQAGSVTFGGLGAGAYTVKVTAEHILPARTSVTVRPGEEKTATVRVALKPARPIAPVAPRTKQLQVVTQPAGLAIYESNRKVGTTPHTFTVNEARELDLTFVDRDGLRLETTINAGPGGMTGVFRVDLAGLRRVAQAAFERTKNAAERTSLDRQISIWTEYLEGEPGGPLEASARNQLGSTYGKLARAREKSGDLKKAIAALDEALKLEPGDPDLLAQRGALHSRAGNSKRATDDLNAALAKRPNDIVALRDLAAIHVRAGDTAAALKLLTRAIGTRPRSIPNLLARANVLALLGKTAEARRDLDVAVAEAPDNPEALVRRAALGRTAGDLESAMADADAALRIDGAHAGALAERGQIYLARGNSPRAYGDLRRALDGGVTDVNALEAAARAALAVGKPDKALDWIVRAMAGRSTPELLCTRAEIHHARNDEKKAMADLARVVKENPKSLRAHRLQGTFHHEAKRYKDAAAAYTKAIKIEPGSAELYDLRGRSHAARRRYLSAISDFTSAIRRDGTRPEYYEHRAAAYGAIRNYIPQRKDRSRAKKLRKQQRP